MQTDSLNARPGAASVDLHRRLRFSVVVPVRDQPDHYLRDCLAALVAQDYPAHRYEIIVVDDGPSEDVRREVAGLLVPRGRTLTYLPIPHQGPAMARNAALAVAKGELVAFTDADCRAEPGWLTAFDEAFGGGVDALGGLTVSHSLETFIERYADHFGSLRTPIVDGHGIVAVISANCCWRADVLRRLGGFNAAYGRWARRGLVVKGYEDVELCLRAAQAGCRFRFIPAAVVAHRHRSTLGGRLRQFRSYGTGYAALQKLCPRSPKLSRYHLDYPFRTAQLAGLALAELLRLPWRLFMYDNSMTLSTRTLYPAIDYLQRLAFYRGFRRASLRLRREDQP